MANFKTPVEEIIFRSSSIGAIAQGYTTFELSESEILEVQKLQDLKNKPEGLTIKQGEDFAKWEEQKTTAKGITATQEAKRLAYAARLVTPKGLTEAQETRLTFLLDKSKKTPELSQGAKTEIKKLWLRLEKGFKEEVITNKLSKGKQGEERAISLISDVDNYMYFNNNNKPNDGRVTIGNITGACDIVTDFKDIISDDGSKMDMRIIDDAKCSWNPRTFMAAGWTTDYKWQGVSYMYLYKAQLFRLRHCLIDCPPDVLADEYRSFCYKNNIIDDSLLEYKSLIDQFYSNYQYENSGKYTKDERVKTFKLFHDDADEKRLLDGIKLAVEYYQTITLNMIE